MGASQRAHVSVFGSMVYAWSFPMNFSAASAVTFRRNLIVPLDPWLKPNCIMRLRRRPIQLHHNPSCTRVPCLGRVGPFLEWRHVSAPAVGGPLTPDPTRLIRLRGCCELDPWLASSCLQHSALRHRALSDKAPERHEQLTGYGHDGNRRNSGGMMSMRGTQNFALRRQSRTQSNSPQRAQGKRLRAG
jgi:hypothetical protein